MIHWSLALTILLNGAIVEDDGRVHEWIGYTALGLVGLRLVWAFAGPRHARFSAFPPNPVLALRHIRALLTGGDRIVYLSHNPVGALMVWNIWASVIGLGVTGYLLTIPAYDAVGWVEETHEVIFGWLVFSVVLHIAGVVFDTWWTGVNLIRAMITGRKSIRKGRNVK